MMQKIKIERGKTVEIPILLSFNISEDIFTCEIRTGESPLSGLVAVLEMSFETDGTDGKLLAILYDYITTGIPYDNGYMMLRKMNGPSPIDVFDKALEVEIVDSILV